MQNNQWIWQSSHYPRFIYDKAIFAKLLDEIENNANALNAIARHISNENLTDIKIHTLTDEITNTAYIEGEILQRESVRSSLRKKLDKSFDELQDSHSTNQTDNLTSILLDTNLNKDLLSVERLHGWHNCLFESGYSGLHKINVAKFRDNEILVVSGKMGQEKIHYEAIPAKNIQNDMQDFLSFCNTNEENAYIKSALAHLWFVIIHPYDDGNGRIARAIADYLLPNENIKLYSLSSQIKNQRKAYYEILEQTTKNNDKCDISKWLQWHLETTNFSIKNGFKAIDNILLKTRFWDCFRNLNLNNRQKTFLNKVLDIGINDFKGNLNAKKYAIIAKTTQEIAQKDIDELLSFGCIKKTKEHSFELCNQLELQEKLKQNKQPKPKRRRYAGR